ncbi:GntR family transcriptional regulator [Methylobacterium sp. SyP6R]|uniref:GntR family transcriptional regulator n=1 Tax=Methylobacterium sp. SyP6R TaxID=2718876 RepID=UPI001F199E23|nr:GntR family transcriptional regulator [Methylobacterium sp. SyP6R]MCF4130096.1 GntR family transcriptional regulator [Methylobacterium sp. SyP6R]
MADALRSTILHGTYAGGEHLRQDAVASQFGVSQTIVREAFKQLVGEGLLVAEPRRGVRIPVLTADEAYETTKLRSILEPQALAWAIPLMSSRVLDDARAILERLDASTSVDDLISLNSDFHDTLYAPCGRQRTLVIIRSLRMSFERYLRFTWTRTEHQGQSQREHWEIYALCRKGAVSEACALLQRHVMGTGELLIGQLEGGMGTS